MYSNEELVRLSSISKKMSDIYTIIDRHSGITTALSDIEGQSAILIS
jgi:hypothetical protein